MRLFSLTKDALLLAVAAISTTALTNAIKKHIHPISAEDSSKSSSFQQTGSFDAAKATEVLDAEEALSRNFHADFGHVVHRPMELAAYVTPNKYGGQ
jgi:hypothetical protein